MRIALTQCYGSQLKMQHKPDAIIMILLLTLLLSSALLVRGDDRVAICHIAQGNLENTRTLQVDKSQVKSYLAQGDLPGACESQTIAVPGQNVASAAR